MQLVHMVSWKGVPSTLRTRPRAVQLRWGWHCSELELLAEKVPGRHCWHCVSWVGVPRDEMEDRVRGTRVKLMERVLAQHHPRSARHPPRATTP